MTKAEFVAQLDRAAAMAYELSVTSAILRWTSDQLKRGEPPWWRGGVAKAWDKRRFTTWGEPFSLYLAALHFEALNDAECPLVPYFPSCGGTADADPSTGLAKFFTAPPATFFTNLRDRRRYQYSEPISVQWVNPAHMFFQKRGLPFYLVESNAGAGLTLMADFTSKNIRFDSSLVEARIGLDPQPLDLTDLTDRRWLTAATYPDFMIGIRELDTAIDAFRNRTKTESAFIQLVACAAKNTPAFVTKNVPADDPNVGILLLNIGVTGHMTDSEYAAYSKSMASLLNAWGDRGLWVEIEFVRGELYPTTVELRVHRVGDGKLKSLVMMTIDPDKTKQSFNERSAEFLKAA